jgi:hypothetical protein
VDRLREQRMFDRLVEFALAWPGAAGTAAALFAVAALHGAGRLAERVFCRGRTGE